eukprot:SAG22_NODE_47_length_24699_cov_13.602317_16_plen_93_part_00
MANTIASPDSDSAFLAEFIARFQSRMPLEGLDEKSKHMDASGQVLEGAMTPMAKQATNLIARLAAYQKSNAPAGRPATVYSSYRFCRQSSSE